MGFLGNQGSTLQQQQSLRSEYPSEKYLTFKFQLLRKRHIGNDIVTVIFQEEGAEPFTPKIMRSHFQHVFVVVRVEKPHTEDTRYS